MKRIGIFACFLLFFIIQFHLSFANDFTQLDLPDDVKAVLNAQWGDRYESRLETMQKFPARLIGLPLKRLFGGKIGQSVGATIALPYATLSGSTDHFSSALYRSLLGYATNPLLVVNHGISDFFASFKTLRHAHLKSTSRIQVCTCKFPILPMEYIYFVADQGAFSNFGPGLEELAPKDQWYYNASNCFNVPIKSGESTSLALERLSCISRRAKISGADFINYNCGGITRDILHAAGLSFPDVSNLGIGSNMASTPKSMVEGLVRNKIICNGYIEDLRTLIFKLEKGEDLEFLLVEKVFLFTPEKDAILQLVISAYRGQNENNINLINNIIKGVDVRIQSIHGEENKLELKLDQYMSPQSNFQKIAEIYRVNLKKMLSGIPPQQFYDIKLKYPILRKYEIDLMNLDSLF